jgi:hypothetical protein
MAMSVASRCKGKMCYNIENIVVIYHLHL